MENNYIEMNAEMEEFVKELTYTEKFDRCKRSWIKGALWGSLMSLGMGLLLSELFGSFLTTALFFLVPCITTMAAVFALRNTDGFGMSKLAGIFTKMASGEWKPLDDSYECGMDYVLLAFRMTGAVFGLVGFGIVFPLETVYYWLRCKGEKKESVTSEVRRPQMSRNIAG